MGPILYNLWTQISHVVIVISIYVTYPELFTQLINNN